MAVLSDGELSGDREGTNLTFDCHVDTLAGGELWLHQHVARVLALINVLLHIREFQSPIVLKRHLAMVKRKQIRVLIPLDGVIRIANHTTVNVCVPTRYCCDVFHWSNTCRPWRDTKKLLKIIEGYILRVDTGTLFLELKM